MSDTKKTVNNFDVLKHMCADNLDIRLGTDVVNMLRVKAGTQITMGIGGDQVASIYTGQTVACLILYNKEQFEAMKKKLEAE